MAAVQQPTRGGRAPQVGHPQASAHRPPVVRPVIDRSRGRFLGITVGHVVAWQVAVAAVLLGLVREDWVRWLAIAVAGLVALPTLLPVGRRWCYQWLAIRMRFWWRVPSPEKDPTVDPRLAPLRELLPDLEVTTAQGRGGTQIGVVHDGQAWVAVVGVQQTEGILPPAGRPAAPHLPMRSLADVLAVDDVRLAAVQALTHLVPAPSALLGGRAAPAVSYQQLGGAAVPATQLTWIALRLDPALCPDAVAARGGGLEGIHRVLRRCIARTAEVLESAGVRSVALDEEGVRAALAMSAGVAPRQAPPGTRHTGEDWHSWTCDGVAHQTYWLAGWPADPARGITTVLDRLGAIPSLSTALSVTFTARTAGTVRFRAMVRLSGTSAEAVSRAGQAFEKLASSADFRTVRLDGEQAPAAIATMPLGGGAQ